MKSPRPKPRPQSKLAPKKSIRPKARPEGIEYDATVERGNRAADREGADKMAKGGKCRGMGAASKGGKYSKAG